MTSMRLVQSPAMQCPSRRLLCLPKMSDLPAYRSPRACQRNSWRNLSFAVTPAFTPAPRRNEPCSSRTSPPAELAHRNRLQISRGSGFLAPSFSASTLLWVPPDAASKPICAVTRYSSVFRGTPETADARAVRSNRAAPTFNLQTGSSAIFGSPPRLSRVRILKW